MAGENVLTFTDDNWETEVVNSSQPVLVDFWAVWCGPCKAIAPIVDELASEYSGRAKIGKVDVDSNKLIPGQLRITSIPTVLVFNGGKVVQQLVGARKKSDYAAAIDSVL